MKFELEKPALSILVDALGRCGHVISMFMKFSLAVKPSPESASLLALNSLFTHPEFQQDCAELGLIALEKITCATLNRLEFEGSLTSVLLEGGCHRSSISEHDARVIAREALAAIFPKPFDDILVCRLDDPEWSEFSGDATISHSYVVCQSARGLWWMLCVADID